MTTPAGDSSTSASATETDRIVKKITLKGPRSRVWRALSDYKQFGTWFNAVVAEPFVEGASVAMRMLYPGYEHLRFNVLVERVRPEGEMAFRWHPYPVDDPAEYVSEPMTLVEFTLLETEVDGRPATHLTVVESGFDKLPTGRREIAFRMNSGGWEEQLENIEAYVAANP